MNKLEKLYDEDFLCDFLFKNIEDLKVSMTNLGGKNQFVSREIYRS